MQNSQSYEFLNVRGFCAKVSDLIHLATTYFKIFRCDIMAQKSLMYHDGTINS